MRERQLEIFRFTRILPAVVCLSILATHGCRDNSTQRTGADGMEKSTAQEKQQQEIDEYIAKMSPLLQEHGFPHVTMKPISEGGERKILLQGEVVSKTDRGVKDSQIVLEAVLTLSDPPAEIVNKVRYRLRDY